MDARISNFMQVASVRRYEFIEGKERGIRVLDCDNGKLRFLLNESKALDIMQLYHEGQNISFLSKNAFTLHRPNFANRFEGGMLYTCGLDSIGNRKGYEMHGTFHNLAARIKTVDCDEKGITIEAEISDTALFGKNLIVKRRIYAAIGSESLEITDTLENRGYKDEEYCLLYHVNIGYPMLDDESRLECSVNDIIAHTQWAEENQSAFRQMTMPASQSEEMCYFLQMQTPEVSLINPKIRKKFTLQWSKDTLPHFLLWKSMCSGDYALGLEPCSTQANDKFQYSKLKAGESVAMRLNLSVNRF